MSHIEQDEVENEIIKAIHAIGELWEAMAQEWYLPEGAMEAMNAKSDALTEAACRLVRSYTDDVTEALGV